MMNADELSTELNDLIDSLDEHVTHDNIARALDELRARIQVEGVEGRAHVRAMVEVNAEQDCSDFACSHEDGCPTKMIAACLGCSEVEPNDDGIVMYQTWEMSEWRHHVDRHAPCADCLHGDQLGNPNSTGSES